MADVKDTVLNRNIKLTAWCTYSEFGTSMLLAIKPQFTRMTTITNKLNNVYLVKKSYIVDGMSNSWYYSVAQLNTV